MILTVFTRSVQLRVDYNCYYGVMWTLFIWIHIRNLAKVAKTAVHEEKTNVHDLPLTATVEIWSVCNLGEPTLYTHFPHICKQGRPNFKLVSVRQNSIHLNTVCLSDAWRGFRYPTGVGGITLPYQTVLRTAWECANCDSLTSLNPLCWLWLTCYGKTTYSIIIRYVQKPESKHLSLMFYSLCNTHSNKT